MTIQLNTNALRVMRWFFLINALLVRIAMAEKLDPGTEQLIGFIDYLHRSNVPMHQLLEMVASEGAVNPILEEVAVTNSGWRVFRESLSEKLSQRTVLNWRAIGESVNRLLQESQQASERSAADTEETRYPLWYSPLRFISIKPGELPEANVGANGPRIQLKQPLQVADTPVLECHWLHALGKPPEKAEPFTYAHATYWRGKELHPQAPLIVWHRSASKAWPGSPNHIVELLDRLNQTNEDTEWEYDLPTYAERIYIVALALAQFAKKHANIFWPVGTANSPELAQYGYFDDIDSSPTYFVPNIRDHLPMQLNGQPIWGLIRTVDELAQCDFDGSNVFSPIGMRFRALRSYRDNGGDVLLTISKADKNHILKSKQYDDKQRDALRYTETEALNDPYSFWLHTLTNRYEPGPHIGARLVKRPKGNVAPLYYARPNTLW